MAVPGSYSLSSLTVIHHHLLSYHSPCLHEKKVRYVYAIFVQWVIIIQLGVI